MGSKTFLEYLAKLREGSKAIQSTNRDRDGPTRKAEREKSVEESLLNTFRLSLLLGARRPVTDTVDDLQPYARRQYDELKDQLAEMTLEQKTEKLKELKMQVESRLDESEQDRVMEREAFFPSLSSFPDKPAKPIRKQVVREGCWTLPELLSAGECKELIGLAEKKKFEIAESFCHLYANRRNDRMVSQDVSLAAAIYNRTKASLPPTITLKDGSKWEVQGINPHLRFCKYYPGHYFGAHLDGMYTRDEKCKSLLTIMIYLNDQSKTAPDSKVEQDDGFTGGSTWFLDSNYKPKLEVKPEAGLGIIFYQDHSDLLHEGSLLLSGVKYILRSDVMYRLVSPARATSQSEDTDSQQSSSSDRDSQQQQQTPAVHHSSRTQTRAVMVAVVVLVAAVLVSQLTRK